MIMKICGHIEIGFNIPPVISGYQSRGTDCGEVI